MIHRLGMYYLARRLQNAQDRDAALQRGRRAGRRNSVLDHEEFGMLARTVAVLATAIGAVGCVLWLAN